MDLSDEGVAKIRDVVRLLSAQADSSQQKLPAKAPKTIFNIFDFLDIFRCAKLCFHPGLASIVRKYNGVEYKLVYMHFGYHYVSCLPSLFSTQM